MHSQVENIHGVTIAAKPRLHDPRGWFIPAVGNGDAHPGWILQNISRSQPGVLRGLHYQDPNAQAKLLTVIEGTLQDIVADLRIDSPTFGKYAVYHLDADGQNQLHIPKGCAHGFLVTGSSSALITYLADAPYLPECEKTLAWNHSEWNFPWQTDSPILSQKDREGT